MNEEHPTFKETGPDQFIHEIASPLIAVRNGKEEYVSGTAFVIGRFFAITAYHVLADFVERYEGVRDVESSLNISFEILLFLTQNKGRDIMPMKVMRVWRSAPLDLAVIALGVPHDWPDDYRWKAPAISLLPPKVGTRISAFGFATPELTPSSTDEPSLVNLHPVTATGLVQEIHHDRRDAVRLPFPCFCTNARFDGGMSGGPVFNEDGCVCGVVCSSFPALNADESHVSYVSTLWPIIGTMIDATESSASGASYYPLHDLFKSGAIYTSDLDHVELVVNESGTRVPSVRYDRKIWEKSE